MASLVNGLEVERGVLMSEMEKFYERLTGCKCSAQIFVVRRDSVVGCYSVHRLGSGDFYEVNITKETLHA